MKPVIGITCKYSYEGSFASQYGLGLSGQRWNLLAKDYVHALELAGAIPLLIPVHDDIENSLDLLSRLDGVLFSGGSDVDPSSYGEEKSALCGKIVPNRDEQELVMARHVLSESGMPALFICRGVQVLNVAAGGSLCQDLPGVGIYGHLQNEPIDSLCHGVKIESGSPLSHILHVDTLAVNSFHHQAIKSLGRGLSVAAVSDDGDQIIEAVHCPGREGFLLGVQWHPEMLVDFYPQHLEIIEAFTKSCL